jgi:para-aminobenzoate synthetase/4-amino-4-deoxychorismate lyase
VNEPSPAQQPAVLLESFAGGEHARSFLFSCCEKVIQATTPDQVTAALAEVETAVAAGKHAAGFVSYEAASGLNPELPVAKQGDLPLVWFGIFTERHEYSNESATDTTATCQLSAPELSIDKAQYLDSIEKIHGAIAQGQTYQVNFTTRQRFRISGDPFTLYRRMCRNQQAPFCGWLDIGSHRILSASPELFFSLENDRLTMKPMKGTATRRPRADDDRIQRELLASSTKDRAENMMIVDLVRNDLSRIAETGSVQVPELFHVTTYPTVHQMTSTVTARLQPSTSLTDIFRALFPCGSVTGAPKRRTMEIIHELETQPRGVYCGAIGYVSPRTPPPLERGGTNTINVDFSPHFEAVFSVAIRTAIVNAATGDAQIGIGSGITWDSKGCNELRECLSKSAFLSRESEEFSLIESIRFDRQGYLLLERHLARLAGSAEYFGFEFDRDELHSRLDTFAQELKGLHKVRILLASNGDITLESQPVEEASGRTSLAQIAIAEQQVNSADPFLYHKTTRRTLYDQQLKAHPDCYDVLFLNERNELTEGCFNNIVIFRKGELLTPALDCGLLPGVLREELLEVGAVRETVLTREDLQAADIIWLVNSVRGWRECKIYPPL